MAEWGKAATFVAGAGLVAMVALGVPYIWERTMARAPEPSKTHEAVEERFDEWCDKLDVECKTSICYKSKSVVVATLRCTVSTSDGHLHQVLCDVDKCRVRYPQ